MNDTNKRTPAELMVDRTWAEHGGAGNPRPENARAVAAAIWAALKQERDPDERLVLLGALEQAHSHYEQPFRGPLDFRR